MRINWMRSRMIHDRTLKVLRVLVPLVASAFSVWFSALDGQILPWSLLRGLNDVLC